MSVVSGQWSTVNTQQSTLNSQYSTVNSYQFKAAGEVSVQYFSLRPNPESRSTGCKPNAIALQHVVE
ncbi:MULTISPECIES: hypothetical protein [Microcoleaceae]|uniref:hypothetical protein n=1 Tax=Microcoleaceae TaxID=1892252 RepID=UPI00187EC2FD|nr:hypothetical protein [Tychonema sp. LEGE 06208]MBE9165930.1 hypothetical protein [Tychonema sp. LEGE 06208]